MSLKEKALSGFFWSYADNFAKLAITFVVSIILARLLTPREFGLIGMTTILISISQTFVDSGFEQALIRKKICTQADLSTVFYFNLLISISVYFLLFLFSDYISQFFNEPQLTAIIQILGLVLIVNGLTIVQQALLTKEINFKLQTYVSLIASGGSGVIGIVLALNGYGVWSLVATTLSNAAITSLLLWLWNSWRPSLIFSFDSFREMFSFGSKLLVSGLINTVYRNIYLLIIGRYFSTADLGYYARAESFQNLPSQNLTTVVQRVSYPVLATLQHDIPRLKAGYQKLIKSTMLISFILMLGLAAVAEPLVLTLIGEKWRPSITYLQLLCFVGMLYPLHAINLNMLNVIGRSDLFLRLEIVKKLLAVPVVVIGVFFGIKALLVGMIINSIIAYFLNSYWSGRYIGYSSGHQLKDISPSFILATVVGLTVYLIKYLIVARPLYQLIVQVVIGGLLTIGLAEGTRLDNYLYVKSLVFEKLAVCRSKGCARLTQ